ncbi:unnamed protein product [Meloidogyne enterolobii]|uniref:Uncharacterized protein n=1 Tax=Meloidogyne enterolobii TaxID=390850 RepID=A0ACB0XYY2_MELEN
MRSQCAKSCAVCSSSGEVSDANKNEKEDKEKKENNTKENCGKKDHDGQVFGSELKKPSKFLIF